MDGYVEIGEYAVTVFADPGFGPREELAGGWWAWAAFQRKAPLSAERVAMPGFRHQVPGAFVSRDAAIEAAYSYARRTVEAGDVGL